MKLRLQAWQLYPKLHLPWLRRNGRDLWCGVGPFQFHFWVF